MTDGRPQVGPSFFLAQVVPRLLALTLALVQPHLTGLLGLGHENGTKELRGQEVTVRHASELASFQP